MEKLELIRQKIDWISITCANPKYFEHEKIELSNYFDINDFEKVNYSINRSPSKHIAIIQTKDRLQFQFEGQYFSTEDNYIKVLSFILNRNNFFKKKIGLPIWKITRIDLASDFLNCNPRDLLPSMEQSKYSSNFKFTEIPYVKNNIAESVTYKSPRFEIVAYRKDIEQKVTDGIKKAFYDLNDERYKDKEISRLEVRLKNKSCDLANSLFNNAFIINEVKFVQILLKDFCKKKRFGINKITHDKSGRKQKRNNFKLHPTWDFLMSGETLSIKTTEFASKKTPKDQSVKRALKLISNAIPKKQLDSESITIQFLKNQGYSDDDIYKLIASKRAS